MNFTSDKSDLINALSGVLPCTSKDKRLATFTADNGVTVYASDNERSMAVKVAANVKEPGDFSIDAYHLLQVVKVLPDGPVRFDTEDGKVLVHAGPAEFKINIVVDGPVTPPNTTEATIGFKADALSKALKAVSYAVSEDANRYGINGCLCELIPGDDDKVRFVGTDGSRLAYCQVPFDGAFSFPKKSLLPRNAMLDLIRLCSTEDEIHVGFSDKAMVATGTDTTYTSRLVDGEFPPYRKILPEKQPKKIRAETNNLVPALRRVSLEATDKANTVRVDFSDESLTLSSRDVEKGDCRHPVACESKGIGDGMKMGFNAKFLMDALVNTEGTVNLLLDGPLSPCVIKQEGDEDSLYVVMPIRLD